MNPYGKNQHRRKLLAALLLMLFAAHPHALCQTPFGPIPIRNQFPFSLSRLTFEPSTPAIPHSEKFFFRSSFTAANNFRRKSSFTIDSESYLLDSSLDYGVMNDLALSIRVPIVWQGGGIFDHAIREWHSIFNLPGGKRSSVPDYQFDISGRSLDDSRFAFSGRGVDLLDISTSAKWLLWKGESGGPALHLALEVSFPTSTLSDAPDSPDLMPAVRISQQLGDEIWGYAGLGIGVATDLHIGGLAYEALHAEAFGDIEYRVASSISLLGGLYAQQTPVRNIRDNAEINLYLDTGIRCPVNPATSLSLLIRENPAGLLTTDITVLLGFEYRPGN